jgi:hypothetical protein
VIVVTATPAPKEYPTMAKENEIVVRRVDLPKVDREFGITEEDRDLSKAKVLIEGKEAERVSGDKDSVIVRAPFDGEHDGPLQIVVTTNSDKPVGILNYWWNKDDKKWEFRLDPDHDGSEDGMSPVVKAIEAAANKIVEAIGKKPAGGTAKKPVE